MQVIIHQWAFNGSFDQLASLPRQELVNDWFGYDVEPSAEFAFATDGEYLWFLASRSKEATVHPDARPGQFLPELWRYDLAEWVHGRRGRHQLLGIQPCAQRRVVGLRLFRHPPGQ